MIFVAINKKQEGGARMVSSSVRTMSFLSNQAVSTRREVATDNKTDDFAKMMDQSINKAKDISKSDSHQVDKSDGTTTVHENDALESVNETVESEKTVEEISVDEELNTENIDEDVMEEMPEEISNEILNVIASILNISIEELKQTVNELNIENKDMLDIDSITKLVMDVKNVDTKFDLLVNEDASNAIKDIQKAIEDIINKMEQSGNENNTMTEGLENNDTSVIEVVEQLSLKENTDEIPKKESVESKEIQVDGEKLDGKTQVNIDTKEFASGEEKDSSKEETKDVDDNSFNTIGDLKNDVISEIENLLNDKVDENVSTRIINQITENIAVAIKESVTSLEMQLYPEHLGKVSILLTSEENGITAKITTETEMAKNAIEQQLTILKENFEKQGLKIADIEVTIASHGFEQNLDKENNREDGRQNRSRGVRRDLLDEINGASNDEEKENIVMQTLGNTVSYLA